MPKNFLIIVAVVVFKFSDAVININNEVEDNFDIQVRTVTGVETFKLEEFVSIYIPVEMTASEKETNIRERQVVPSLDPQNKEYPTEDESTTPTYVRYTLSNLKRCYKIKNYITQKNPKIIIYVAAPGEYRRHQRVRTLIQEVMRRRDHHLIFVNCLIPSLQNLEKTIKFLEIVDIVICAKNIAVCNDQLQIFNYETHLMAMGFSAQLLSVVTYYSASYPHRITALDPMRLDSYKSFFKFDLFNFTGDLRAFVNRVNIVAYYSNMGAHGMREIIPGAVNIILNDGKEQLGCDSPTRPVKQFDVKPNTFWKLFHGDKNFCSHELSSAFLAFYIRYKNGGKKACRCRNNPTCCQLDFNNVRVGLLDTDAYYTVIKDDYYVTTEMHGHYYPEVYYQSPYNGLTRETDYDD